MGTATRRDGANKIVARPDEMHKSAFIGGEWVESESGQRFEVRAPYDGSLVGTVPKCTKQDAQAAIDAAREAQKELERIGLAGRCDLLKKAEAIAERRKEEWARKVTSDIGKTIREARDDVFFGTEILGAAAENIKRFRGTVCPWTTGAVSDNHGIGAEDKMLIVDHEPVGVVGVITPWNWTAELPAHYSSHALAAGNSIIFKPPSSAPMGVIVLAEIYEEAGFPKGSVNLVTGPGDVVGEELVSNPGTDAICFVGEVETGRRLTQVAGIKPLLLELGGNNPVVIMDDANVDAAVADMFAGQYYMAGQVCVSTGRVIVHEKVLDEFVEKLAKLVDGIRVGDPWDEDTDMGPLQNLPGAAKVQRHYDDARAKGAEFVRGGKIDGLWAEPSICIGVTAEMLMAQEETFGPCAEIRSFSTLEEGIAIANEGQYGLNGAGYTSSLRSAFLLARGIKCGTVLINETTDCADVLAPFGGMKQSGLGREGSDWLLERVTNTKQMHIDYGKVR